MKALLLLVGWTLLIAVDTVTAADSSAVRVLQSRRKSREAKVKALDELWQTGGLRALKFLRTKWRPDDEDLAQFGRAVEVRIALRTTSSARKNEMIMRLLSDSDIYEPGVSLAIEAAGEAGLESALPRLEEIAHRDSRYPPFRQSVQGKAYLATQKIRLLSKNPPTMAYLLAAECDGKEDGKFGHHPCPLRLWGIERLGLVNEQRARDFLYRLMNDSALRSRRYGHGLSAGKPVIDDDVYAAFYHHAACDALRAQGLPVTPDPHVRKSH